MTACGAAVLTVPTFAALVVLLFWVLAAGSGGNQQNNNNGEYRPWWDFDFRPEQMQSIKIDVNLIVLIVACGTLFVPINKAASGVYERFNVGVLASSMYMFGNMLLLSFWYLANLAGRREEDQNNRNGYYNNNNNRYYMDERELLAYNQKVVSFVLLALSVAYFVLAAGIHGTGEMLPQTLRSTSVRQTQAHMLAAAQYEGLSNAWSLLSLCNVVVYVGLFVATLLLFLGGEDVERMVEEARILNLLLVLLCLSVVSVFMLFRGNAIFGEKRWGSLGVGMVYGATKYFSALLLLVTVLFANLGLDDRDEEGVWVTSATSLASLVLCVLHFAFAMRTRSYQKAIYDANAGVGEDVAVALEAHVLGPPPGDFVRVDETGMRVR